MQRTARVRLSVLAAIIPCLGAPAHAAPGSQPATPPPEVQTFRSAKAALRTLLRLGPAVIGFGEYHQKHKTAAIPSSLHRFTRELLPLLRRRASDLVIETWITAGNCGEEEQQVVKDVDQTTQRPEKTESEIVTLVKRAQRFGIRPHILEMTCEDYKRLLGGGGDGVNYEVFLKMTADQLTKKVLGITKVRLDPMKRAVDDALRNMGRPASGGKRDIVLVYGGALHNDLAPQQDLASFSYARKVDAAVARRYVEVDVFVPEYIEKDDSLLRKQAWFPLFEKHQSTRRVLLIRRGERSYAIIFRRSRAPAKPPR